MPNEQRTSPFTPMNFIYNVIQILLIPPGIIVAAFYLIIKPSKRASILNRLGLGLILPERSVQKTIWIHALSVGEVTSAHPLVKELAEKSDETSTIIFSVTTRSGRALADRLVAPYCDSIIYFPFDIAPVVIYFLKKIKPDLFILIETDFWPNFIHFSARAGVSLLLFNGRISDASMKNYQRFSFFFRPMFDAFSLLCMQTDSDAGKMQQLGIRSSKIKTLGNLKFSEATIETVSGTNDELLCQPGTLLLFGGSTHEGEEIILIDIFRRIRTTHARVHLVLAPRDIERCAKLALSVKKSGLTVRCYSVSSGVEESDVTLIDTIGDLTRLYRFAGISFIGGSLVPERGHNPLEAARHGCPVLFGPHMDDFSEISSGLVEAGGAFEVTDEGSLYASIEQLIANDEQRRSVGENARRYTARHNKVLAAHIEVIDCFR